MARWREQIFSAKAQVVVVEANFFLLWDSLFYLSNGEDK